MSRVFGKTTDGADVITADAVVATSVTTNDLMTNTEEASVITASSITSTTVTTATLSATNNVTVYGTQGNLQASVNGSYGTITSSTGLSGISLNALGSGKVIDLYTNGVLRASIQDTRTTIYGDLYVTGNIYNVPTGYTFFTPVLTSISGGLGTILYTAQTGVYSPTQGVMAYQIEVAGSYTSSSSTQLVLQTVPAEYAGLYVSNNTLSTLQNPSGSFAGTSGSITLDNPVLGAYTPLSGTSSFDIVTCGLYLTAAGTSFTPVLTVGTGSFTYSTQTGSYVVLGNAVVFFVNLVGTYTGVTTSSVTLNLPTSGLTSVSASIQPAIGGVGLQAPTILSMTSGTGTFMNQVLNTNTPLSGSGSISVEMTGIYLTTGALSFTPQIIAVNGTWIETGASYTANYNVSGNLLFFTIVYSATVTSTSTLLEMEGFPIVMLGKCVVGSIMYTGLNGPFVLEGNPSTTNLTFISNALGVPLSTNFSGRSVTLTCSGYYIIQ